MRNRKSHDILQKGLQILVNLDHRGATGADAKLGDGCGVLAQIPHGFFAPVCAEIGILLPEAGHYAIGQFFMPSAASGFSFRPDRSRYEQFLCIERARYLDRQCAGEADKSDVGDRIQRHEPLRER